MASTRVGSHLLCLNLDVGRVVANDILVRGGTYSDSRLSDECQGPSRRSGKFLPGDCYGAEAL